MQCNYCFNVTSIKDTQYIIDVFLDPGYTVVKEHTKKKKIPVLIEITSSNNEM